ncbi:MAG: adenosylcobinamide-GDP ribazoletransferase, partial [Psychromonas sp.]|nr:adenosylcobinamide-GDP ribazoletransferase [Psychromonas sp.]
MFSKVNFQFTLFIYALSYFTRIPIPAATKFDNAQFYKGSAYLPVIGAVIALLMISSFWLFSFLFNTEINLILTLTVA